MSCLCTSLVFVMYVWRKMCLYVISYPIHLPFSNIYADLNLTSSSIHTMYLYPIYPCPYPGKTSLLNILIGDVDPTSGRVIRHTGSRYERMIITLYNTIIIHSMLYKLAWSLYSIPYAPMYNIYSITNIYITCVLRAQGDHATATSL